MRTTVTDDPGRLSVCLTRLSYANAAELIEVLLGLENLVDEKNTELTGSPDFSHEFDVDFAKLLWPLATKRLHIRCSPAFLRQPVGL